MRPPRLMCPTIGCPDVLVKLLLLPRYWLCVCFFPLSLHVSVL